MKKKLILLGIHLTVVALVLILTMVTLAWYTKNETVTTSNTIITAEPIDNLGITEIVENIVHYKGETGLGGELDAPYIATKIVSISQESKHVNDAVTCALTNVSIKLANGEAVTTAPEGFDSIADAFTFRISVVTLDADNKVESVKGVFYPNENDILVDSAGKALTYQSSFFDVDRKVLSATCTATIRIELIFLDEASYVKYTTPDAPGEIIPFSFSDYKYMGSTFYANFSLGVDEGSQLYDANSPIVP